MTALIKKEYIGDLHIVELDLDCSSPEHPVYVVSSIERYTPTDDIWHEMHTNYYKDKETANRAYSQAKYRLKKQFASS